jgi:hypothetical protein
MIDEAQIRKFNVYVNILKKSKDGDERLQQQLLSHSEAADKHLNQILSDATQIGWTLDTLAKEYSKDERALIRQRESYTPEMFDKLVHRVLVIAGLVFKRPQDTRALPDYDELPNTLLFRVSLCCYLLAIRWGSLGGASNAKPAHIRNDLVDATFAAYGTYFDGILSNDENAQHIHSEARILLNGLFNAVVPSLKLVNHE